MKLLAPLALILAILLPTWAESRSPAPRVITVGIIYDGPSFLSSEVVDILKKEVMALMAGEFDIRFLEPLSGGWTKEGVSTALDTLYADPGVDFVFPLGIISATVTGSRQDIPKPTIIPFVTDNLLQGMPESEGTSGVLNLSYIAAASNVPRDIGIFRDIVEFSRITLLLSEVMLEGAPEIFLNLRGSIEAMGVEPVLVKVGDDPREALLTLPPDTEAVYIAPLVELTNEQFLHIVNEINSRGIPSFALLGRRDVEKGVLAGIQQNLDLQRICRRSALNMQRVLLGEEAGSLPITFTHTEELVINMSTARKIGFSPTWHVFTEAFVINEDIMETGRHRTLLGVVQESVAKNLDLLAADRSVSAGREEVALAISALLPQSDISARTSLIDADRAEGSFGSSPERSLVGSISLSQLIFSEPTISNVSIQKKRQRAREQDRETLKLDIVEATAVAYLDYLRLLNVERIRRENLKLSRSNLDLSEIRRSIGVATSAEVYRWQSEIATDRIDLVRSKSDRRRAEALLNRLLHRPIDEVFTVEDIGLLDPAFMTGDPRLDPHVNNPVALQRFTEFVVEEGFRNSPELKSLDATTEAQSRVLISTVNSFWAPTVSAVADLSKRLAEGGAGASPAPIPGLTIPDDLQWSLTLQATFPLFRGGAKIAEYKRAREGLFNLRLQRASVLERVEERVRDAMYNASASYPSIEFSRDAANAARKNLDLVLDSYSRGTVSILDLLDAQSSSLQADLNASNAVYTFLIDLMGVERASGNFWFLMDTAGRDGWFERMKEVLSGLKEGEGYIRY